MSCSADDLSRDLYHQLRPQAATVPGLPACDVSTVLAYYDALQKLISLLCEDYRVLHDVDRSGEAEPDQS